MSSWASGIVTSFYLAFLSGSVSCLDNGLGRTPQMGWNTWNAFACNINHTLVYDAAVYLKDNGFLDAGYQYVNLDDCWQISRDNDGYIIPDPTAFPDLPSFIDSIHKLGFKFGLYSDAGHHTCAGRPGSLGYEKEDAESYAKWGVDYLKYDNCFNGGIPAPVRYPPMRDALNKTGHPIFFSMCEWGRDDPALWARDVGNSWRTTGDITYTWPSIIGITETNNNWWKYAGPGGWNDPDMLEVGNGNLTLEECRSHFSLWAIMKAPLILGFNPYSLKQPQKEILLNRQVIEVNQDPLGQQARMVKTHNHVQYWQGQLSNGYNIVLLLNLLESPQNVTATWTDFGLDNSNQMQVYDLWNDERSGTYGDSFTITNLGAHECVLMKTKPVQ